MAIRTFLALDLEASIRDHLASAVRGLPEADAKIRWVATENLHVTLKFLGDVPDGDVPAVCHAVSELAGRIEPFDFDVSGLRCVPPAGKVRMVWAAARGSADRLATLFREAESALGELGFPRERRGIHPHVTLGRVKLVRDAAALRAAAARYAETLFGTQHASGIVVYRSELTPRGPLYTPMAHGDFSPV